MKIVVLLFLFLSACQNDRTIEVVQAKEKPKKYCTYMGVSYYCCKNLREGNTLTDCEDGFGTIMNATNIFSMDDK